MPRSRKRPASRAAEPRDLSFLLQGWKRTEMKRGREYFVQPVGPGRSEKEYLCPQCGRGVRPGSAHLVVWRADDLRGDDAALAERRHWHDTCWTIA